MGEKKHQDYIYEMEDYYNKPKEMFNFVATLIKEDIGISMGYARSVLDIGCAKGEFLYFLHKQIDCSRLVGLDYSDNLIQQAKNFEGLNNIAEFFVGSAETFQFQNKFDVITMLGVLSYFDDTFTVLKNMQEHLTKNGTIYILGFFNDYDIDVLIKYRNNKYFNTFEAGWNYHSISTIKKNLIRLGMTISGIDTFKLSFDLLPQTDPARSWHIKTSLGTKFTNGLGLIYDMRVLKIRNISI